MSQHVAGRIRYGRAILVEGVVDHLECPVRRPGGGTCGRIIRLQDHVGFSIAHNLGVFGPAPRDGLVEDRVRKKELRLTCELRGRHGLAPRDARKIGDDAFDLVQALALDVLLCAASGASDNQSAMCGLLEEI